MEAIQQRVEDVERTNARLTVRVEEVERQHLLLQDRVDSNRIALQRRGYLRQENERFVRIPAEQEQRPAPAPESSYRQAEQGDSYQADPTMRQRMDRRGVRRIPLSDDQSGTAAQQQRRDYVAPPAHYDEEESGEELVLTNEILDERYGTRRSSTSGSSSSTNQRSGASSRSAPHAPVTDERLPTTAELEGREKDEGASSAATRKGSLSQSELLDLYQDSLAQYRAGDYGDALQGFRQFLNAGPRQDYRDNALYWIGECHYGLGSYERSVEYFQKILDELPSAGKVPDAMLKMSLAYDRLGQPQRAVSLLEELVASYPTSNPGRLGKERLEEHPLAGGR